MSTDETSDDESNFIALELSDDQVDEEDDEKDESRHQIPFTVIDIASISTFTSQGWKQRSYAVHHSISFTFQESSNICIRVKINNHHLVFQIVFIQYVQLFKLYYFILFYFLIK